MNPRAATSRERKWFVSLANAQRAEPPGSDHHFGGGHTEACKGEEPEYGPVESELRWRGDAATCSGERCREQYDQNRESREQPWQPV